MDYEKAAVRFQQRLAEQMVRYEGDLAVMADEKAQLEQRIQLLEQLLREAEEKNVPAQTVSVNDSSTEEAILPEDLIEEDPA